MAAYHPELTVDHLTLEAQETMTLLRSGAGATCLDWNARAAWEAEHTMLVDLKIVLRLAEAGAAVVITARGQEALAQVEAKVLTQGGQAVGVQADAASLADARRVIDLTVSRFGGVDILVNNAAVFPASLSIEVTEHVWDETVDTDLKGSFFVAQAAANAMINAGRGGRIINVLSAEMLCPTVTWDKTLYRYMQIIRVWMSRFGRRVSNFSFRFECGRRVSNFSNLRRGLSLKLSLVSLNFSEILHCAPTPLL